MLSRNTDAVADFKLALIVALHEPRDALKAAQSAEKEVFVLPQDYVSALRRAADLYEEKERIDKEKK